MNSHDLELKENEGTCLYWLTANPEHWKGAVKETSEMAYDVKDKNGKARSYLRDLKVGDLFVVYQVGSSSLVAIFQCVKASDGIKVVFGKIRDFTKAIRINFSEIKADPSHPLHESPIIKMNTVSCVYPFTATQAEWVKEMINASEGKDVFACVASEGLNDVDSNKTAGSCTVVGVDGKTIEKERNRIVFGAPGTGKSYKINNEACRHKDKDDDENYKPGLFESKDGKVCRYERVTFYPTYSYAQFVGTYKPVMRPVTKSTENGAESEENKVAKSKEEIAYEFVPGPFLRVLVNALKESVTDGKKNGWCLNIEEINRANAAAVFGDVFQLLDRGWDGVSEYSVAASEDIKGYLKKVLKGQQEALQFLNVGNDGKNDDDWNSCSLRIPDNMYIWATMNSADQGVFPMDTAFKRRWEFEYVGVDEEADAKCREWTVEGTGYNWNDLRRCMNGILSANGVNEDKLMGPYFIRPESKATVIREAAFKSKVLMYIWEDAGRMIRRKLFGDTIKTYSQLIKQWNDKGISVVKKDSVPDEISGLYDGIVHPTPAQDGQGGSNTEAESVSA